MAPLSKLSPLIRFCLGAFLLLTLAGCWDRRELNDVVFPLASAIDLEPDGKVRVTGEFPIVSRLGGESGQGGGGGKPYFIESEKGETARDAFAKMQLRLSRSLNVSHRRVLIIGEDYARQGIRPIFDSLGRTPDIRLNGFLVIAKGKAYDLIKSNSPMENLTAEPLRELVKELAGSRANLKNIAMGLGGEFGDPIIVYIGSIPNEKGTGKPTIGLLGYAQLHDDKMVGSFTDDLVEGISLLINTVPAHVITAHMENKAPISILLKEGITKINPKPGPGGKLRFDIQTTARGVLVEDRSGLDLNSKEAVEKIQNAVSQKLKSEMTQSLKQMQAKQTDSVKLGNKVWQRYPRIWKDRYASDWGSSLQNAEFNITVRSMIGVTGMTAENIARRARK
ncbi:Ger(x)C family spore germination protein [Gorillibacterium massiliense]|uniref:Ger(x)C family spore germination protein n=1 Tax=Gorillibacterium massiliense TaxID=1280390 RepID=UPI0004B44D2F|nr:Ger(x)C family spore germination protein [Gorillibacterium massiliense]